MSIASQHDLQGYCQQVAARAKASAAALAQLTGQQKNDWLRRSAEALRQHAEQILTANKQDILAAPDFGLTDAQIDRLKLSRDRIEAIAVGMEQIALLPDPVGELIDSTVRPNGLRINKVRVPLGVVFFIYESRPNVTADAAAICVKSGNAVILRGGKEAAHSSQAIVRILTDVATKCGLPPAAVQLVDTRDREAVSHFLALSEYIDVAIPRGGEGLIRRVTQEATMPVIKHFDGNCHVYVDGHADLEMAVQITVNSKCQRMGVCNAAESLVVHRAIAATFLPRLVSEMAAYDVEIRGDEATRGILKQAKPATEEDYRTEFLGPIISVKIVDSLEEAINHINEYGSGHTDAIVTDNLHAAREFTTRVDSSAVMVNASTRFNDGGEFGLGAEIGISTDRFHARGPCGLRELTSYKYIVEGQGQVR
jgi:glutamate-5-semialdehyde dehydrogenase